MLSLGDFVFARSAGICAALLCFVWIATQVRDRRRLCHIPVAPNASWLWGNEKDVFFHPAGLMYSRWFAELGRVFRIKGALTKPDVLVVGDPAALAHIMQKRIYQYPHSAVTQNRIGRTLGRSLGWVEGESEHRRMRALVAPALTLENVRAGATDIYDAISTMEARLAEHVHVAGGAATVNIMNWISAVTLDIIGRYGFSHDFEGGRDAVAREVLDIWRSMSMVSTSQKGWNAIMVFRLFPFIDRLPLKAIKAQAAVRERLHAGIAKELARRDTPGFQSSKKDLLSRLLNAHHRGQIPEDELIAHIAFLIMAGFETTAQGVGYAIWQLARRPEIQKSLREEVASIPNPTFDDYTTKMPLLDAVVKESLRLSPSVPYVERVAEEDDVLPLTEPIVSDSGEVLTHIEVKKGQAVQLPYIAINRLGWIDGECFRPGRWLEEKRPGADELPRGWSSTLAFGDGPRNCVGFRLALFEFKAIVASLIRHFEFQDTGVQIDFKVAASVQAYVRGREAEGPQLPVIVKLL